MVDRKSFVFSRYNSLLIKIIGILLLAVQSVQAQDGCAYFATIYTAQKELYFEQDSAAAFQSYQVAFDLNTGKSSHLLSAIELANRLNKSKQSLDWSKRLYAKGFTKKDLKRIWQRIGHGQNFEELHTKLNYRAIRKQYRNALSKKRLRQLKRLARRDQKFRKRKKGNWEKIVLQDAKNQQQLKTIIESQGRLPYYSEIGLDGMDNLELLFIHMDKTALNQFLPMLIQAIRAGQYYDNEGIAYQIDRVSIGDQQLYQLNANQQLVGFAPMSKLLGEYQVVGGWGAIRKGQKLYFIPFDPQLSPEQIDAFRNQLCLDPMEQYKKRRSRYVYPTDKELKNILSQ